MNRSVRALTLVVALLSLFAAVGCSKLKARDQLNKGVQSYKNQKYEEAIEHFKSAVADDPSLTNAKLYLATAYAQQYVPGADTPENIRNAEQAIDEFKKVLESDPKNINSIKGIASLYFNMKRMDLAKQYYAKAAAVDPNDPEIYYSIGVIDWTQSYQQRMEERAKLGLKPTDDVKDKKTCNELLSKISDNQANVDEGIKNLDKAMDLRHDYEDAMAYMNLLYREKADFDCANPEQRVADLKTADSWVDKTLATKKAKAEKASNAGGITLDQKQ
jgi:tetratricopeptide (TPR) repeat protein